MSTKPYNVFFVLNGLLNGEDGVYAVLCDGEKLRDGWYWIIDGMEDPVRSKPHRSREAAMRDAEEWKERYEELLS